ncbi:MAG: hypothetical protein HN856_03865 [Gammaproteobacteria bacterium]|nr:hypothetical protein [Gammaproteobacteria bacterium]
MLKKCLQGIAFLLVLSCVMLFMPGYWMPAVVKFAAVEVGLGKVQLTGFSWNLDGMAAQRLQVELPLGGRAWIFDAQHLSFLFSPEGMSKSALRISELEVTNATMPLAEALPDVNSPPPASPLLLPAWTVDIGEVHFSTQLADIPWVPRVAYLTELFLDLSPNVAIFSVGAMTELKKPLILTGSATLDSAALPQQMELALAQAGGEPVVRFAAKRRGVADAMQTYVTQAQVHVEAIDQNLPGLVAVINKHPQLRKLAQLLLATTVSWRAHGDVTVSGDQLDDVAIDLVHELDLTYGPANGPTVGIRGCLRTSGEITQWAVSLPCALQVHTLLVGDDKPVSDLKIALNPGAELRLNAEQLTLSGFHGQLESKDFQGRLLFMLPRFEFDQALRRGDVEIDLSGSSLRLGSEPVNVSLSVIFDGIDGFNMQGRLASEELALQSAFNARRSLTGDVFWSIEAKTDGLPALLARAGYLASQLKDFEASTGSLLFSHTLDFSDGGRTQSVRLDLLDVSGSYDGYPFTGMNVQALLSPDRGWYSLQNIEIYVGQVDVFFPIYDVTVAASLLPDQPGIEKTLRFSLLELSTLEGVAYASEPFDLALESWHADVGMQLKELRLARMLEAYSEDVVEAGGEINGYLPVSIRDDDIFIEDGWAKNNERGGYIRYRLQPGNGLAGKNEPANVAFQLLEDFNYSNLGANVTLAPSGDLVIDLTLDGHNPNVLEGQRVLFNVNLEQNIFQMIDAWRVTQQYLEAAGQRLNRQTPRRRKTKLGKESADEG